MKSLAAFLLFTTASAFPFLDVALPSNLWVCRQEQYPLDRDCFHIPKSDVFIKVGLEDTVMTGDCRQVALPTEWIPFIVHHRQDDSAKLDAFAADNEFAIYFPLEKIPEYSLMWVHPAAYQGFETLTLLMDKQVLALSSSSEKVDLTPKRSLNPEKDAVVNTLNGNTYYTHMEKLTGEIPFVVDGNTYQTKTRYSLTPENVQAAAYIRQEFLSYGYTDVFYQEFRCMSGTSQNIIAVKPGTTRADEIVVFGAHMDSISQSPTTLAPGCIDNGSGADGVLETARAFANITTDRTIHFAAWGCEEQGIFGSQYYVDTRQSNGYNVKAALIMDMIGYSNRYYGVTIEGTRDSDISDLMDLMEENVKEYSPSLTINKSYVSFGSDHIPFQRAGIPSYLGIEQDDTNYPGYHRTTDTISYLNTNQSIDILRGMTGTLYDLTVV